MKLVNPNILSEDQRRLKDLAVKAMQNLEGVEPLDAVYALCLALAKAASHVGITHIEDVTDQVTSMFRSIEAAKSSSVDPRVHVVSPEQFRRIANKYGVKLD